MTKDGAMLMVVLKGLTGMLNVRGMGICSCVSCGLLN